MTRLGVLGGTFDPPHLGHLVLAEAARVQFALDRVLFVPAGDPYHRRPGSGFQVASARPDLSPSADRLAMTRLAVAGNDAFAVDDREVRREGPSYTVDTLAELAREMPAASSRQRTLEPEAGSGGPEPEDAALAHRLFLLLGADAAAELHRWKEPARIAGLANILVAPRGDRAFAVAPFPVLEVDMPRLDITSTLVRERSRAGLSIRYLVPDAVADYIERGELYRGRLDFRGPGSA